MIGYSRSEFIQLWNDGVKISKIARKMNCTKSTVSRWAKGLGLAPRAIGSSHQFPRPLKDYSPVMEQLSAMLEHGATVRWLAKHFRISTRTVCRLKRDVRATRDAS